MRVAKTWDQLKEMVDNAFPRQDETLRLPFFKNDITPLEAAAAKEPASEPLPLFAQLESAQKESS
jgi:hypothetical protein